MIDFESVEALAAEAGLTVTGWFHPSRDDDVPDGTTTMLLLGPGGPAMWHMFERSEENRDGAANPLDRWSRRVIDDLAKKTGAKALFPFGGPPWHPFQKWAERGEGARASPVAMQVSPTRGLWASYRGALVFREKIQLPDRIGNDPCLACPAPCQTACPVNAFASGQYDVPACTSHLTSPDGAVCLQGCLVRRACPAGAGIDLPQDQRAFHMAAFVKANQ